MFVLKLCIRCTAQPTNLDGPGYPHSREFDQELMDTLDSEQLWDNYGIDNDIIVRIDYSS